MSDSEQKEVVHNVSAASVFKVIALVALVAGLYVLRDIVLVVLVAVVIASALEPSTKWLVRHRWPRVISVIFQYLVLAVLLTAFFYFLVIPLVNESSNLLGSLPSYVQSAEIWNPTSRPASDGALSLPEVFSTENLLGQLNRFVTGYSQGFFSALSNVFGGLLSFILIVVLSFYLSVQERGIARFLALVTPLKHRHYILSLWNRSETKIGRWMQGQLILAAAIFAIVFVGLKLFGIPHALPLAFLAGVMEIIPIFGPILAAVPGVLLAFVDGGASKAIFVALFYTATQQLENHVIYPQVVKKVIGVPPIMSILALIIGGRLFGFLGIIVSVPVAAVLMEYLDDVQRDKDEEEERLSKKAA